MQLDVVLTLRLTTKQSKRLDELSSASGLTRPQVVRMLIDTAQYNTRPIPVAGKLVAETREEYKA